MVEFYQIYLKMRSVPQSLKAYEFNNLAILLQLNELADLHVILIHARNAHDNKSFIKNPVVK